MTTPCASITTRAYAPSLAMRTASSSSSIGITVSKAAFGHVRPVPGRRRADADEDCDPGFHSHLHSAPDGNAQAESDRDADPHSLGDGHADADGLARSDTYRDCDAEARPQALKLNSPEGLDRKSKSLKPTHIPF